MAESLQKVHNTLSQMQKNLECSICLELLQDPVLTKCEHHFCNFCILSLLQSKKKGSAPCPLCKEAVTKRGLIKHDSLKNIVSAYRNMVTAVEGDTGRKCTPPRGPVRFSQPEPPSQRPKRLPKKAAKKSNVRRGKTKGQPVMPIYLDEEEENEILGQSTVFKSNTNVRSSFPSTKETGKISENKLLEDGGIENDVSVTSNVDQPIIIEVLASESLGEVTEGPDGTLSEGGQKDIDKGTVRDEQPNSGGSSSSFKDPYEFIASQRTPRKIKVKHVKEKKKKPWEYSFGKIGRKKKVVQAGGTKCYEVSQSDDDEENDSSLIHREDIDYLEEGEQVLTSEQNGILNDVRREGIIESETEKAGENGGVVCEMNGFKDDDEGGEMDDDQVEVVEVQKEEVEALKNDSNSKRISRRGKRTLLSTQFAGEGKAKRRSRDAAMKALDAIKGQSHSQSSGESSRSCTGTASCEASPLANANGGNSRLVMLQESQECYEKRTEKPLDVRPVSLEGGRQEMPLSQPPKLNRNHGDRLFATAYGKGKNRSPPQKENESKKLGEDLLLDDLPDLLDDVDGDSEDERYGNEEVSPGDEGLPADVEDEPTIDMEGEAGRKTNDVIDLTDDGDEVTVEKEQSRDGAAENNEDMAEQVEKPVTIPQESDSFVTEGTIKSVPEVQNEISEINHSKTSTKESSPNNEAGQNGGGTEDVDSSVIGSEKKRQTLKERMRNEEGLTASDIIDNPEQDHKEHLQSDWEFALKLAQELGSVPSNLKVSEKDLRNTGGRGRVRRMAQLKIQNGPEESEKKKRRKRNGGKCGQTSKERADTDVEIDSFNGDSKNDENVSRVASVGESHQQGRKRKGRRLVNEEKIQSVPETPVVKSKLIEKPLVMDQDGDEECFGGPPDDVKERKTITKDASFESGDDERNVELDVEMVEGSKKVKAVRKGKTRGRKMNSEEKQTMERKEDDVIEIVDEEKQEGHERKEDLETTGEISDKNGRRKSTRLCKDNEMGKGTPSEKTKHKKKKGKETGSFTDEMSATLKIVKDVESVKDLGDELTENGANDRKGNETKKSKVDVAEKDKQREEIQMKELKDHDSKEGNKRRRSSRLSKSQERVTGNSERKAASQCEANKERNTTTPGVVDEQCKGQIKSTRLSKSQEHTQEKTPIAGRRRKLSQEPKHVDVDVQLVRLEKDRQEVDESQKTKRRSSRLSKSQEDAALDERKKTTPQTGDEGVVEVRTASCGKPHIGTERSPRRCSLRSGENSGMKMKEGHKNSPLASKVASSESVTESIDLDEPECNDKGFTGHSQPSGNKSRGKGSPGGSMTQESLSLLRGENGSRSIQTDVGHSGAKSKGTLTVGVTESASDASGDTTKQRKREPLTKESEDRELVEMTDHPLILTKEKKKNSKIVSSGSARRQKTRGGDKSDQQLRKNQAEGNHNLEGASDGILEGDDAPRRNLRSRQKGRKERNSEQVEESKDGLRNSQSLVERTPDAEIVDVEELARNYDRTMNSKAGQSSPDIFTMHLENSEDLQNGSDADSERRKDASQENTTGGKNEGDRVQSSKSQRQQKRKRKTFAFGTTDMKEDGESTVNNSGDAVTQKGDDKVEQDKQEGEEPQNRGENGQSTADQHVSATLGASASPDDLPAAPLPGYHHLRRRKKHSADTVIEGDGPEQSDGNVSVKRTSQRRRRRRQNSGEDTPGTKNKRFCQDLEGVSGEMVDEYSAVSPTPHMVDSTPKLARRKNKEIGLHAKASEEADGSKSLVEAFREIQSQRTKVGGKESQVGMSMGSPSISLLQGVDSLGQMDLDEMGDAETQETNIKSKVGEVRRDGAEEREGELPAKQTIEDQSEVEVIEDEAIQEEEKEVENKEEVVNEEDGVKMHTETSNNQKSHSEVRPADTFRVDDQLDGDEDEEIRPETSHVEENPDVTTREDDPSKLVQDIDELDGEEPLFDDDYASQDSPIGGRHNLTSASSVLSSQSDLMNSQQQENAKETLKKMEQEIAEMERALKEDEEDGMGDRKKDLDVISDESDTDDEPVGARQDVVDHDDNEHGEVEDDGDIIDGTKDGLSKSKDEVEEVCGSTPTSQKGTKTAISEGQTSNLIDTGVSRGKSSGQDLPREGSQGEEDATKAQAQEEKDVAKFKSGEGVRPEARRGRKSRPLTDREEKTKLLDDDDGDDDVVEHAIDERGRRNSSRSRTLTISRPSNGEKKSKMREKRQKRQGTYSRYKDIESIEDEDIAKNVRENLTEIAAAESSFDSLLKRFSERRRKSEMLSEVEQKTDEDDNDCGSERQSYENAGEGLPTRIREPSDSPRSPSPPPVLSQRTLLKRVSPLTGNIEEAVRSTAKRGSQEKPPGSQKKRRRVVVEESESEDEETGLEEDAEKVVTTTKLTPEQEERRQTASQSRVPMVVETAQGIVIPDRKRKELEFTDNPRRSGDGTTKVPQEEARDQEKVQSPQNIQQTNSSEAQRGEPKKKRKRGESMSLIASGLNKQKLKLVEKLCKKAGCHFSNTFSLDTTHVIVNADENLCCERTLKYFQGIAAGKWVISYQWVHDSLSSSRLLPQEKYEIRGDSVNGRNHCGPMRARLWKGPPLLSKFNFFCLEPYTGLSTDQLKGLLTSSGGIVYSHPSELPRGSDRENLIIAQSGEQEEVDYNALYQKHLTKVISREWVLDSIAIFTAQPVTAYLLCDVPDEGDTELDSDDEF